ncbi:MAG: restriction endonuclease subunit S [Desulfobacterales bacterium]|nr:restriction endonuclease subunit S [Desulfobacterales bacterium]
MAPKGWKETRLGEVAVLQRGFDLPKKRRISGSTPIISSGGVIGFHNRARVKGPGIVTGRYGTIGEVFYVEEDFWPLNTALYVKNINGNNHKYVYYLLCVLDFKKFSDKTGVPGVNRNDLHEIKVTVPPMEEQRIIARILSTWDKSIEAIEKLIENGKALQKALVQQLFTGKMRFNGFSGKVKKVQLRDIADIDSKTLGKETSGDFTFRYISISDVKAGRISNNLRTLRRRDAPSRAKRVVRAGDVLLATVRPHLQAFARADGAHVGCIASTAFAILSPRKGCDGEYLRYYLFSAHITGQMYGLVVGSNYPAINSADVKRLAVYCPDMAEQRMIAGIFQLCEALIVNLGKQSRALQKQKKALMQQLLTGKRRVTPDTDLEISTEFPDIFGQEAFKSE